MSKAYISQALRERVAAQARHRCGYCLAQQDVVGALMEIDHLIPEALQGKTEEANLWLACKECNGYKGDEVTARDPQTGEIVPLFNPREQSWKAHFAWTSAGEEIVGLTAIGRRQSWRSSLTGRCWYGRGGFGWPQASILPKSERGSP